MPRKLDRFTTALSALLVLGALLACKKKTPVPAPTSNVAATPEASVAPPVVAPVVTPPPEAPQVVAKLGEVKRYTDKEKPQTGAARVLEDGVKVFNEADDKTADVATLDKGLLVFRLASIPDWELVEFPSGVGKVSPGWVQAKLIDTKSAATVARDAVATQTKQATPSAATTGTAKTSSSAAVVASAKPTTSATATAAPTASVPLTLAERRKLFLDLKAKAAAAAASAAAAGK